METERNEVAVEMYGGRVKSLMAGLYEEAGIMVTFGKYRDLTTPFSRARSCEDRGNALRMRERCSCFK
jgi:hypothetical protein